MDGWSATNGDKMTQKCIDGGNLHEETVSQIKKEETTKKWVKIHKRARQTKGVAQTRLGGGRIHSKTMEFHKSKDGRKKTARKRVVKVAEEESARREQTTLI